MKEMSNYLLTAQEHSLIGSSVPEKYRKQPYIPLAVLDNEISAKECDKIRQLERTLSPVPGFFWDKKYVECTMTLEPLELNENSESYRETKRDPILIELSLPMDIDYNEGFPYAREDKPRVKLI